MEGWKYPDGAGFLDAINVDLNADRLKALSNIITYLKAPVGIGEHSDLFAEVKKLLLQIDQADSALSTLAKYFAASD